MLLEIVNVKYQTVWRCSAGLLAPLAVFFSLGSTHLSTAIQAKSATPQDVSVVFCLAANHRVALVDAAVALGVAVHGKVPDELKLASTDAIDLTPEDWLKKDPADFVRTCDALIEANASAVSIPGQSEGVASRLAPMVTVLLPVTVGALLTFLVSEWRAARDRAKTRAEALRAAARNLLHVAGEYGRSLTLASVGSLPDISDFERRLFELISELTRLNAAHRRWVFVAELKAAVQHYEHDFQTIPDGDSKSRRQRDVNIRNTLQLVETDIETISLALEAPRPYHGRMRNSHPLSMVVAPAHNAVITSGRP